jgi:hypothetical protein
MIPYYFRAIFLEATRTPSDVNEHMVLMNDLAQECSHIVEFGVRWGTSTKAWLNSKAEVLCYDIEIWPEAAELFEKVRELGRDAELIKASSLELPMISTDLLFIDSLHNHNQLKAELALHADGVRKYIVLHDTTLFADRGEDGGLGLWPAVAEFLATKPEWRIVERRTNNNGLTVLGRTA